MAQRFAGMGVDAASSMAKHILARHQVKQLRCVTVDVTGTLIAYKGELGDYYSMAATRLGLPSPDYERMHQGFKVAYEDMVREHPCFGAATRMPAQDWWRPVVHNAFIKAGCQYDHETLERVFNNIFTTFSSCTPYMLLPDAKPFLRWIRKQGIMVGIISNAEHQYPEVVLPNLGLQEGSEWDFGVFSGIDGVEKPNPAIYKLALQRANITNPQEVLHIGDNYKNDYEPAKAAGLHAVLLDRFQTAQAKTWRQEGALVFPDLIEVQKWLHSHWGVSSQDRLSGIAVG